MKKKYKIVYSKQICFFVDAKLESKLKKMMKKLKLKSMSETVRNCIENFK